MNALVTPSQQQSNMQALVPRSITEAMSLSEMLSASQLVPKHLQGKPADCLLIVMQAQRWGMDVLSVAQCTSIVSGKLCYEGKLVAAVIYSMGAIQGRLRYEYSGEGIDRKITVTGRPSGMDDEQVVEGTVKGWKTSNDQWTKQPDDMLVYRGTRQWARRYAPEALLGVYTPDEIDESEPQPRAVQVVSNAPAAYPDADFAANLPKWRDAILSGKKTADAIIAMVESKGALTELQRAQIRTGRPPDAPIEGEFVAAGEKA